MTSDSLLVAIVRNDCCMRRDVSLREATGPACTSRGSYGPNSRVAQ